MTNNDNVIKLRSGVVLAAVVMLCAAAWAQEDAGQQVPPVPVPAFGQEPPPPQVTQAPPVTSLDEISLEPTLAARSFLQPGVHVTESVNSNLGQNGVVGITRVLGSLDMTRLWSRYTFLANYEGGLSLYSDSIGSPAQVHALAVAQRYAWRTGQLQVRDSLSYLPEGSFGFSGFNGAGGGGLGGGGFGNGTQYGSLGLEPRLTNAVTVDVRESLSPRSSITAAGGYTFTNFLHNTNTATVNSRQDSAQLGYSRVLNHADQVGVNYGFQYFEFPTLNAGAINSHTMQFFYQHQISGRMDLILGVGPQYTVINAPAISLPPITIPGNTASQLSLSVRTSLKYRFPRASVGLSFDRGTTAGSGIHLGSQSNVVRFNVTRPLSRLWTGNADLGYSRHTALQVGQGKALGGSYQSGFGGGGLNRRLGRYFSLQFHYQYNFDYFHKPCSALAKDCAVRADEILNRQIGEVTLSWHPSPIKLD